MNIFRLLHRFVGWNRVGKPWKLDMDVVLCDYLEGKELYKKLYSETEFPQSIPVFLTP